MAVGCSRCGREYDVPLFEFGRTIWCTCGARVAAEPRARNLGGGEPRFFADAMLGRLARWLRTLGFDCAYENEIEDEELVRRAIDEQRTILSRDRALPQDWRVAGIHLVRSEDLREQLREVLRAFGLVPSLRLFSRCNACNHALRAASKRDVAERVPPYVRSTREQFFECPGCGRVYWEGTHTQRMRRVVEELLAGAGSPERG